MRWFKVGKTIVSHPEKSMYALFDEEQTMRPVLRFGTLADLATFLRGSRTGLNDVEVRCIKNELPAIVWKPDDTLTDTVLECQRLDEDELRELARLLRQ
ncbi:MAG TPA: hypothetical protein VMU12_02395 [Candidatus Paceibacterota bacterium]|nr:hypothetical protein [Candidatus Paceibacterota bacterium]